MTVAKTLDQAIAFHGGEAGGIAQLILQTHREERAVRGIPEMLAETAPAPAELVASAK